MTAAERRYIACETCERPYPEETGVAVEWDVMGDPRQTVEVCPACAFAALAHARPTT